MGGFWIVILTIVVYSSIGAESRPFRLDNVITDQNTLSFVRRGVTLEDLVLSSLFNLLSSSRIENRELDRFFKEHR